MRRPASLRLLVVALSVLVAGPPAGAAADGEAGPARDRMYLLGADTGYLYWSVDPADPELASSPITRSFNIGPTPVLPRTYQMFFRPASLFDGATTWDASRPLRFHFELEVTAVADYTVHLAVQQDASSHKISDAATQVAPGVWEGTHTKSGSAGDGSFTQFAVVVITSSPRATLELQTAGRSYVDLPAPTPIRSVPELLGDSPPAVDPNVLETGLRSFRFNDRQWTSQTFEGTASGTKEFQAAIPRDATFALAWVEMYDAPFLHDITRGREPDSRKLTDLVSITMLQGGQQIGESYPSVSGVNIPAGVLTIRARASVQAQGVPFKVHLVTVYGDRTLASMRWRSIAGNNVTGRHAYGAICSGALEPIPASPAMTTMRVSVDWDSESPFDAWTLAYSIPNVGADPCGASGQGNRIRFTIPANRVWYVGATPNDEHPFVSLADTVFEYEVRLAYSPS